jgi:hypothetical protein
VKIDEAIKVIVRECLAREPEKRETLLVRAMEATYYRGLEMRRIRKQRKLQRAAQRRAARKAAA